MEQGFTWRLRAMNITRGVDAVPDVIMHGFRVNRNGPLGKHKSIEDSTGYWVTRLARSMEQDFAKRLQAMNITRGGYAVLSAIHHDNKATPAGIASHLGLEGAAVTRLHDRIEKQGLIQRTPSATDRRSIDITLTREGVRTVRRGRADSEATNKKFTECLSAAEVGQFQSTIQTMLADASQAVADI